MIRLAIFDLDGTLFNTLGTIRYHLNKTLTAHRASEITEDECREYIGNGARKLCERALRKSNILDPCRINAVLEEYNRSYDSDPIAGTEPYPGIEGLIDALVGRGIALAVLTNKPEETAIKLTDKFFNGKFKRTVGGRDGAKLKPDPEEALRLCESLGFSPSVTAFIGDTPVDIETGKNMGAALTVAVSWGFRDREELHSADIIADSADEVIGAFGE